jgi:hypothetical protein
MKGYAARVTFLRDNGGGSIEVAVPFCVTASDRDKEAILHEFVGQEQAKRPGYRVLDMEIMEIRPALMRAALGLESEDE